MRRRDFLSIGVTMAGTLATRSVIAQAASPRNRAAVVIGVNKAGNLPVLKAAVAGARTVAGWLKTEGFQVRLFVDDSVPVTAADIFGVIAKLVDLGTLDQLVVYFAGHGCINGYSEFWLLSGAPYNPNEAVSLLESEALARESGISNVVFISDACRSRADNLGTERIRGSLIFPNSGPSRSVRPEVDRFLATLVGDPSYEVSVADSVAGYHGIYTDCFLDAFRRPEDAMVRTIGNVQVVPNRRLNPYLRREVPKRAQAKSIKLRQTPDAYVVSDETTYIGRVLGSDKAASGGSSAAEATIFDVAGHELNRVGVGFLGSEYTALRPESVQKLAYQTGFANSQDAILGAPAPRQFETQSGFAVYGIRVETVVTSRAIRAELLTRGDGGREPALVRVDLRGATAGSVALQFIDGSGTAVAVLAGYVGTVVVSNEGVSNVNYAPSQNSHRWPPRGSDVAGQRAAIATAARFGVFRIEGEREVRARRASQLINTIRTSNDPTLSLYASYAYADAGLVEQVNVVRAIMREDLKADLFDVAMLSGVLSGRPPSDSDRPVPFCPLLSRGWGLLRVRNVLVPKEVDTLRDYIRRALWTTFDSKGMQIVLKAIQDGSVR